MGLFQSKREKFDGDEFARTLRAILDPIAEQIGLNYASEIVLGPTRSIEAVAFRTVFVAAHLYLEMNESESFPARDPAVARLGAEEITKSAGSPGADDATIYLAHAMPLYYKACSDYTWRFIDKRPGEPVNTVASFALDAMRNVFPIDQSIQAALDDLIEGFEIADGREVLGVAPVSREWKEALAEGREPSADADAVKLQLSIAKRWFVAMAREQAIDTGIEAFYLDNETAIDTFSILDPWLLEAELRAMVYWDELETEFHKRLEPFQAAE